MACSILTRPAIRDLIRLAPRHDLNFRLIDAPDRGIAGKITARHPASLQRIAQRIVSLDFFSFGCESDVVLGYVPRYDLRAGLEAYIANFEG